MYVYLNIHACKNLSSTQEQCIYHRSSPGSFTTIFVSSSFFMFGVCLIYVLVSMHLCIKLIITVSFMQFITFEPLVNRSCVHPFNL
jgi:hypothetical protein